MKVIARPKKEQEIRTAIQPDVDPKILQEQLRLRSDCCVNHLCGCNCGC